MRKKASQIKLSPHIDNFLGDASDLRLLVFLGGLRSVDGLLRGAILHVLSRFLKTHQDVLGQTRKLGLRNFQCRVGEMSSVNVLLSGTSRFLKTHEVDEFLGQTRELGLRNLRNFQRRLGEMSNVNVLLSGTSRFLKTHNTAYLIEIADLCVAVRHIVLLVRGSVAE